MWALVQLSAWFLAVLYPAVLSARAASAAPAGSTPRLLLAYWSVRALAGAAGSLAAVRAAARLVPFRAELEAVALAWLLSPLTRGAERALEAALVPAFVDARTSPPALAMACAATTRFLSSPWITRAAGAARGGVVTALHMALPLVFAGGDRVAARVLEARAAARLWVARARAIAAAAAAAAAAAHGGEEEEAAVPAAAAAAGPSRRGGGSRAQRVAAGGASKN